MRLKFIPLSVLVTFILVALLACNSSKTSTSEMSRILVEGNRFINEDGEPIVFKGLNIADPDRLSKDSIWSYSHFQEAKNWGANIVRLPVHPRTWRDRGEEAYCAMLDEAIEWATKLDMYLIIDWHSIGNLKTESFQHKMYDTDFKETKDFWMKMAQRYGDEPCIAMFELFNEPVAGKFGELKWDVWKQMNEELIHIIREDAPETVVLVAGFNWAYDLTFLKDDPITLPGVAYVSHPYPEKRQQPWVDQWEDDWGFAAKKYPLILTEIGFALPEEPGVHIPVHGDETYGQTLVDFSAERGISWVVWCFDARWSPLMYTGDYLPTRQGAFFKKEMLRE